jgi:hypothetical protein
VSAPGTGSTFIVRLPAVVADLPAAHAALDPAPWSQIEIDPA